MAIRFWIPGPLPAQNEILKACRSRSYPRLKAKWTSDIVWLIKAAMLPKGLKRVRCEFEWVSVDKRHDPDNIEAAQKFVWDALSAPRAGKPGAGIIPNDGWAENAGSSHTHVIGPKAGVWVTVVPQETVEKGSRPGSVPMTPGQAPSRQIHREAP